MNCPDRVQLLPALIVGALPESCAKSLSQHLEECCSCREQHRELVAAFEGLKQWSVPAPPAELAVRTYAAIESQAAPSASWWTTIDGWLQKLGQHRPTLGTLAASVAITIFLSGHVTAPLWQRGRSSGGATACRNNLRVLAFGLTQYAQTHQGRYPKNLSQLQPDYLRQIPSCPQTGLDTYGYQVPLDGSHFRVFCRGEHHRDDGLQVDQPDLTESPRPNVKD